MKIVNKVKIGYKDYDINLVDRDIYVDGKECYGQINYDNEYININNKFNDNQKKATFIHEIVHGIDEMWGSDMTEKQVELFSNGLYKFLLDNPEIFNGKEVGNNECVNIHIPEFSYEFSKDIIDNVTKSIKDKLMQEVAVYIYK
ncbi:hypothetical protein [Pseudobacteroides cellulosolvens]|uniref:IrrE N-terminal-like domain-containing protein n=1 Tax=Pseudobacteroides cellulosolvens ATCC 35603 = DSM 2933 TaxID=398512 RepID=A0A0L6JGZ8_9FIRM|nr:hypothetical protein [Pseudobacteroides cellulosolvens]KNY24985.1 hypothetical protein Bccel_0242 [Pseudobacteroides cellulosolvens ATCC 35603 = DSM 2933]